MTGGCQSPEAPLVPPRKYGRRGSQVRRRCGDADHDLDLIPFSQQRTPRSGEPLQAVAGIELRME
jgi:hypothetical protein